MVRLQVLGQTPIQLDILKFLHFYILYIGPNFTFVLSLITYIGGPRVKVPIYAYNIYTSNCVCSKNSP
jgi:hypothetical protein